LDFESKKIAMRIGLLYGIFYDCKGGQVEEVVTRIVDRMFICAPAGHVALKNFVEPHLVGQKGGAERADNSPLRVLAGWKKSASEAFNLYPLSSLTSFGRP
jgi:hypothetical protein